MPKTPEAIRLCRAHLGTQGATARLQGMKLRAQIEPPRAAEGTFPYPHRACDEWGKEYPVELAPEPTQSELRRDAKKGSAKLLDAIQRAAA